MTNTASPKTLADVQKMLRAYAKEYARSTDIALPTKITLSYVGSFIGLRMEDDNSNVTFRTAFAIACKACRLLDEANLVESMRALNGLDWIDGGIVVNWRVFQPR